MSIKYDERVKEPDLKFEYTKDQILELDKCSKDFLEFSKHIKIFTETGEQEFSLYDYQKEMIEMFDKNRFSIVLSSRQSGKCVTGNTLIKIKNKSTEKEEEIKIKDFYTRLKKGENSENFLFQSENELEPELEELIKQEINANKTFYI